MRRVGFMPLFIRLLSTAENWGRSSGQLPDGSESTDSGLGKGARASAPARAFALTRRCRERGIPLLVRTRRRQLVACQDGEHSQGEEGTCLHCLRRRQAHRLTTTSGCPAKLRVVLRHLFFFPPRR